MKKVISFSIDNREEVEAYAKHKGFQKASTLARYALTHFIQRYPMKIQKETKSLDK